MLSRKTITIAAALLLSGASSMAYATELGAESIVHEQAQNQRALAEQAQYLAYHEHFKNVEAEPGRGAGVLPHHN
ncbi:MULTISPECIES: hypothetical protein [unclassified Bosea (in: a-proteobacteria)]|uniref:hypothetical protein n=1 Tax=unclassified Bosea (in: a-proteobacteria) TaxID=2653178 RepID=UPI000F761FAE|nr:MULTISPECIES: hypothetical protein [unclassified Bosea (in: a-proteobacteria)]AZO80167.1 hypothetical protein BLM15_23165 [Bosea sp. Tri-49]RXT22955.1 hypothetical protein B5U98_09955 [Bosea sp. Tri-39]RXT38425.1 hypothetical protein B5U99_09405 [Bosea sp. Tri-54]